MIIDDIISVSHTIKPIPGEFPQKPKGFYTAKQWLDYGHKVKLSNLINGGKIFAMQNFEGIKGYKYFSKNDCEPMTEEEKRYYEVKYKHNVSKEKPSLNNTYQVNTQRVMGANNSNTNIPVKKVTQIQPVFGRVAMRSSQIPYLPNMFEGRRVLILNVETTGDLTKGSPRYGDEILFVSISQGNIAEIRNDKFQDIYKRYLRPQNKTSWEKAEMIHRITPAMVSDSRTFAEEKERIQSCFRPNDIVLSYGDESFKFLEESGIVLPKNKIDLKEMFFKHNPSLNNYSFTNFLNFYCGNKGAEIWNMSKTKYGVDVFCKNMLVFSAAKLQYRTICNEFNRKMTKVPEGLEEPEL